MQLEDYFEPMNTDEIRLKGHRIGIEDILLPYLDGHDPEELARRFPTLSLEQIYATLTFYYARRSEVDAYLSRIIAWEARRDEELDAHPVPGIVQRIRALKAQRQAKRLPV